MNQIKENTVVIKAENIGEVLNVRISEESNGDLPTLVARNTLPALVSGEVVLLQRSGEDKIYSTLGKDEYKLDVINGDGNTSYTYRGPWGIHRRDSDSKGNYFNTYDKILRNSGL